MQPLGYTNLDEMLRKFENLNQKSRNRVVWGASRVAMKIVHKAAVENAKRIDTPKRPGDKVDSKIYPFIKLKRNGKLAKRQRAAVYQVGVEGGAKENNRVPPNYWRHVELGTNDTAAKPFLRPAIENNVNAVVAKFGEEFWNRILQEIARGNP